MATHATAAASAAPPATPANHRGRSPRHGLQKRQIPTEAHGAYHSEVRAKTGLNHPATANMSHMPTPSVLCAMNELSNHDHSRFLTRTNGRVGRLQSAGSGAASEGVNLGVLRAAVLIQMTWPGAPTIYYGDEAGQVGWTDPDNRRTYPWGHEDQSLINLHKSLARLRRNRPVLKNGSFKPLCSGYGFISYARFDEDSCLAVAVNNLDDAQVIAIPLSDVGVPEGTRVFQVFGTTETGYDTVPRAVGFVKEGKLLCRMMGKTAAVLAPLV